MLYVYMYIYVNVSKLWRRCNLGKVTCATNPAGQPRQTPPSSLSFSLPPPILPHSLTPSSPPPHAAKSVDREWHAADDDRPLPPLSPSEKSGVLYVGAVVSALTIAPTLNSLNVSGHRVPGHPVPFLNKLPLSLLPRTAPRVSPYEHGHYIMAPGLPMPPSPPAPRLHTQTHENQRYVTICLQICHHIFARAGAEEGRVWFLGFRRSNGWRRADCDGWRRVDCVRRVVDCVRQGNNPPQTQYLHKSRSCNPCQITRTRTNTYTQV